MNPSLQDIVSAIINAKVPPDLATRIIAVDGLGGSGKSTFAARLAIALGDVPVLHTDDFASCDNPLDWWPTVIEQIFKPLANNMTVRYSRNLVTQLNVTKEEQGADEWLRIEPSSTLIIEGVSASRQAFRPYLTFCIWVDAPRDERIRRGLNRGGIAKHDLWLKWMADEDDYVAREHPAKHVDLVISGL